MLGGENGRSKVCYIQFVQRCYEKQQPDACALKDLNKKTLCADIFNAANIEITYREGIQKLKQKRRFLNEDSPA